jgi:hypothetical protein
MSASDQFQTLQRHSQTPSAASGRSMSPTSGNAMRFPVNRPSQFQSGITTLQKKATPSAPKFATAEDFRSTQVEVGDPVITR